MQQIVYDIIDNCFNYDKNINNENNSAHSDISITPPLSTKGCSNHSNKDSQKDTKSENKKILFSIQTSDKIKITKYKQNNIKNNNKLLEKKRKRIFSIQKIEKKNYKDQKKNNKIIFIKSLSSPKNNNDKKKENNFVIDILINKNNNNKNLLNNNINNNNNNNINYNIDNNINNNNINNNSKNSINNNKNNIDNNIDKNIINNEKKEKDINNKDNNSKKKSRRSNYVNEKELQLMYEKKFLENINKEYSDKDYEKDMSDCLKDKGLKFMKDNFPVMFHKDKYYLYSILPKKRQSSKEYFIESNYFNNKNNENLYNYYDILYNDYDLSYKENFKDNNLNKINKNIINNFNNFEKNNIINNKYLNNDYININNENISNDNIIINNISKVPNIIDIKEETNTDYKYKDNNYFNEHSNKMKIFRIFKTKKLIKNKNNLIKENKNIKINIKNRINKNIINYSNNTDLKINEKISLFPKKVWSLNNNIINTDNFFDDCIQIWPFDECCFVKEIALEFLMKNNYSTNMCLDKIKEFVFFMKKRAKELDFPIISESIKTIKKYNLRKTNFN